MGYTGVNRGCSGGRVSLQGRTLSNVDQNDGLSPTGRRGAQTYLETIRMEDRRASLSQSRDDKQPRQLRVSLHSERCFHQSESDAGSQKLQPGIDHRRRLSTVAHFSREVR